MINKIEQNINKILMKFPTVKTVVKRIYQSSMYLISSKTKYEGEIDRISPKDDKEYFFGYYDKSPWDITDRYMLCLRAKSTYKSTAPKEKAEIIIFDTQNNNSYQVIGETNSWNVQQGCMLQWLGPDYSERIIYNDFRDGKYCSVILNINTREETIISSPIYSVSQNGKYALSLDFSRLHRLRKGYGYSNKNDMTKDEKIPDKSCIWFIDLEKNQVKSLLKYTDFVNFETRTEMQEAEHWVNHIMLNPSGNRFMVLHRWTVSSKKYTRLVTVNIDGTEMYNLNDDDMTSHCNWKNNLEILAYTRKKDIGDGYYLLEDKTQKFNKLWPELSMDGHPSYSPDNSIVVTDTYPNRSRMASVYCIKSNEISQVARVFASFRYDNEVRCDLHPRWNRKGDKICFDAVFEGKRALYTIDI